MFVVLTHGGSMRVYRSVALIGGLLTAATEPARGQTSTHCPPTDAGAVAIRETIARVVTGSDSASAVRRATWGFPQVSEAALQFARDSAICTASARAYALATNGDTLAPPPVHVLHLGPTHLLVFQRRVEKDGDVWALLDSAFQVLKLLLT